MQPGRQRKARIGKAPTGPTGQVRQGSDWRSRACPRRIELDTAGMVRLGHARPPRVRCDLMRQAS